MNTHTYQTEDGITVTREAAPNPRWDHRIAVSHPRLSVRPEKMICGGEPLVDATVARLLRELRALLSGAPDTNAKHTVMGRVFSVLAEFSDPDAANAYMSEHSDARVLAVDGARIILADVNDKGEPA